jgi:hypothetical protein
MLKKKQFLMIDICSKEKNNAFVLFTENSPETLGLQTKMTNQWHCQAA